MQHNQTGDDQVEYPSLQNFTVDYLDHGDLDAFSLRHQIYCVENNFLPRSANFMELDRFDSYAPNAVIRHIDGTAVGVVRVIPWSPMYKLPFSHFVPEDQEVADNYHWGEVSRIGLSRAAMSVMDVADRQAAIVSLFRAVLGLSVPLGVTHWAALMPESLRHRLSRHGIGFFPCHPPVEYHGQRSPCTGSALGTIRHLHANHTEIWGLVTNGGAVSYLGTNSDGTPAFSEVAK